MKKAMDQSRLISILNGVSILALVLTALLLIIYGSTTDRLSMANEERFDLTYNANRFMNGSAYLTNEVRAYASTGDQEHYDNYWREVNELDNRTKGVEAMQKIGITAEEQDLIDEMASLSDELVPLESEAMDNIQAGNRDAALDYVYGKEYSASIAKIDSLKERFLNTLDVRTQRTDYPDEDHQSSHIYRGALCRGHADPDLGCHQKTDLEPRDLRPGSDERDLPRESLRRISVGS